MHSPARSHSCRELIQAKRSTAEKGCVGAARFRQRKASQSMWKTRSPQKSFFAISEPPQRAATQKVSRGDHPCRAIDDATKWRQWRSPINTEPPKEGRVREGSVVRRPLIGAAVASPTSAWTSSPLSQRHPPTQILSRPGPHTHTHSLTHSRTLTSVSGRFSRPGVLRPNANFEQRGRFPLRGLVGTPSQL